MKGRQVLQKTRKKREAKLNDYKKLIYGSFSIPSQKEWQFRRTEQKTDILTKQEFSSFDFSSSHLEPVESFEQLIFKRKILLSLELPFEVDVVGARKNLSENSSTRKSAISTDDWIEEKKFGTSLDQKYRYASLGHLWTSVRPTIIHLSYAENGNETRQEKPVSDEDLIWDEIRNKASHEIENLPHAESTKNQYHSQINSIYNRNQMSPPFLNRGGASAEEMSKYFLYLENACLRGKANAYRNLIEIKLLFYSEFSTRKLQDLTRNDLTTSGNPLQGLLPATFIKLVYAVCEENESIFLRDTKAMNQFIKRSSSSKKAGLLRPLSIKSIRNSLKYICFKENFEQKKLND